MAATERIQQALSIARDSHHPKPCWLSNSAKLPPGVSKTTQRCIDVYLLSQRPNGSMGGIGWWQCANGYTAMALHELWSDDSSTYHNYNVLDTAIRKSEAHQRGLINVFNDDTLWWALLCMHMYALKGDTWYFDIARGIWNHIMHSGSVCRKGQVMWRGHDMHGAVYWTTKPDEQQLNAISTALFAELSVRLALVLRKRQHTGAEGDLVNTYLAAAQTSLHWILSYRYRPRDAVVLDHIKLRADKCVDWTFTYTTAVTLGVCALLHSAFDGEEPGYLDLACHMARKSMTRPGWVEHDGVLTEKGAYGRGTHDPWEDNDSVGFKAVLVRQLGVLFEVLVMGTRCSVPRAQETAEMVRRFVEVNFCSLVERDSNGHRGQYGPWWDGPFECPTSHSQMAVLDVMADVRLVNQGRR